MELHARITAAVTSRRGWVAGDTRAESEPEIVLTLITDACDHADKVLARHRSVNACWHEGHGDPCPEVRDLADLWLGEGWSDE